MKIKLGSSYKSNILAKGNKESPHGGSEVWTIEFALPTGNFLGKCINSTGTAFAPMWREFTPEGLDGVTASGNPRQLVPNTVKKEYWGISYDAGGVLYNLTQVYDTKEKAEKVLTSDTARAYKYTVYSFIREEEI